MPQLGRLRLSSLPNPSTPSREQPLPKLRSTPDRILCFDIENKPGTYGPGDYTHPKVTAIACQWVDELRVRSWVLDRTKPDVTRRAVEEFLGFWGEAGSVMGHNIRGHDIKILNGLAVTLGLPTLPRKPMIDTYRDQPRMAGLSRSLENLCARWDCPVEKVWMPEHVWEQAYDGVPQAVDRMRVRVETDVRMNIWLWRELRRRGLL